MENLSAFLTSLGLQDHLQTFADEGLELQLLPQLVGAGDSGTHADLKELGLSRMGDKLKLIQAVQAMAADERAKTAAHKRDCNEEQGTPARETQEPKRAKLTPEEVGKVRNKFEAKDSQSRFPRPQGVSARHMGVLV